MPDRCLIVADVDNTIYDWVNIWAGAFRAMLRTLAAGTGRSTEHWLAAAHAVHVRRAATECPSLLADLAASATWPADVDAGRVLPAAATAYREHWDHHLTTYPGMREALVDLTEQGHTVVAYADGDVSIAASRLSRLGLAGVIRRVFGRPPLPTCHDQAWGLVGGSRTSPITMDFIPREDSKPNPAGLQTIIGQCDATPRTTIHVGDNLWKDVVMAQAAGAGAFWARYGTARSTEDVALLEGVAHLSALDLASERKTISEAVTPDAVVNDPRQIPGAVAWRAMSVSQS